MISTGNRRNVFLIPSFAVFAVFFVLPLSYFFVISFWRVRLYKLTPDFTFENYVTFYEEYLYPAVFTFAIALSIAVLTTLLAFGFAYFARFRAGRFGPLFLFIALITMFGGYLVKIYAWKTILGTQGIINTGLLAIGVVEEPIPWLLYNPSSVVVTLVHFLLPFAILPIYGSLRSISNVELEAARDLAARPRQVLVDIVLPQCQSGILVAFTLTFLISAGDYVTPRLVGGPYTSMIGNFVESQFVNRLNAPRGSALAVVILFTCLSALLLFRYGMRAVLRPR